MKEAKVRGFFRLNIVDHAKGKSTVVGDSGWLPNAITNYGYETCIVGRVGSVAGAVFPNCMALGTGTLINVASTALPGELTDISSGSGVRIAVTPTAVSSKTLQFVGTLASGSISVTQAIANIGLFATTAVTAGSCIAGSTYTASTLQINQSVNCTYQLRFA
jgi:hypothetical protein